MPVATLARSSALQEPVTNAHMPGILSMKKIAGGCSSALLQHFSAHSGAKSSAALNCVALSLKHFMCLGSMS
eukprot:15926995-Heterocapsa_arctica.AAC.1